MRPVLLTTNHPAKPLLARVALFVLQLGYIAHLFSSAPETVSAACAVGSHFIVNNLLHFAFVMLFVRSHFVWAEVLLVLNFANLTALYFRHNTYPRFIHLPAVSGPLAWTFVALYWNGAIMVPHTDSLVARILANVFVWSILGYGMFFIVAYKVGGCFSTPNEWWKGWLAGWLTRGGTARTTRWAFH